MATMATMATNGAQVRGNPNYLQCLQPHLLLLYGGFAYK